jgi:hypothetical protein
MGIKAAIARRGVNIGALSRACRNRAAELPQIVLLVGIQLHVKDAPWSTRSRPL